MTKSARSRFQGELFVDAGAANYSYTAPMNMTVLQIIVTSNLPPAFDDAITVTRKPAIGIAYNAALHNVPVGRDAILSWMCNDRIELLLGDELEIEHTNDSNADITIEVIYQEAS